jgi:hypothetical protein
VYHRVMQTLPTRAAGARAGDLDSALTIRINSRKRARLDQLARRHGVAAADVMRLALDDFLSRQNGSAPRVKSKP